MKKLFVFLPTAALFAAASFVPAYAAANPSGTGKPSQSCGSATASSEPHGFTTAGFANAESHYNPGSQYDVACYQLTQNGH